MAWLLIIPLLLVLTALPVAFAAVAVRPSQLTIRGATVTLLALLLAVVPIIVLAAIA